MTARMDSLFGKASSSISKMQQQLYNTSVDLRSAIDIENGIKNYSFHADKPVSEARDDIIWFATNLNKDIIFDLNDFYILKNLTFDMVNYIIRNQQKIESASIGESQDFKLYFRMIQEKIKSMAQDREYIKDIISRVVLSTDMLTEDELYSQFHFLCNKLAGAYNIAISAFRWNSHVELPQEMNIITRFPEAFDGDRMAEDDDSFREVMAWVRGMSDYIIKNKEEIVSIPAVQLHEVGNTIWNIRWELNFLVESWLFDRKRVANIHILLKPKWPVDTAEKVIEHNLRIFPNLDLEKWLDLILTFVERMDFERLNFDKKVFAMFLSDVRNMVGYTTEQQSSLSALTSIKKTQLLESIDMIENRVVELMETNFASPPKMYNLKVLLEKKMPVIRQMVV